MCGKCCYGKGIKLKDEEIKRIADFLKMTEDEFKKKYCEEKRGRYELKTDNSNFCIFLENNRCKIHPVKPYVCKLWPFFPALLSDKEEWEMAKSACPGINRECSFEQFVEEGKRFIKYIRTS